MTGWDWKLCSRRRPACIPEATTWFSEISVSPMLSVQNVDAGYFSLQQDALQFSQLRIEYTTITEDSIIQPDGRPSQYNESCTWIGRSDHSFFHMAARESGREEGSISPHLFCSTASHVVQPTSATGRLCS